MSQAVRTKPTLTHLSVLMLAIASAATICEAARKSAPSEASAHELMRRAKSWAYQLQEIDVEQLSRTDTDIVVVDVDGSKGSSGLTSRDVRRLKRKPDGTRRLAIAYLNVGEAEDYRHYWRATWHDSPPEWIGAENCRWKGDHRVRHWNKQWHQILFQGRDSALNRVIDLGFDGVWLDRVDVFYHWRVDRWQAAGDMVELVVALAKAAHARNRNFLIIPQNGEELLSDARYLAVIDGIGKEDMLYGDRGNDTPNTPERVARAERNLAPALAAGLPVLAVEYVRDASKRSQASRRLADLGYVAYLGPRSLAYLGTDGPPHTEDRDSEPVPADSAAETCD